MKTVDEIIAEMQAATTYMDIVVLTVEEIFNFLDELDVRGYVPSNEEPYPQDMFDGWINGYSSGEMIVIGFNKAVVPVDYWIHKHGDSYSELVIDNKHYSREQFRADYPTVRFVMQFFPEDTSELEAIHISDLSQYPISPELDCLYFGDGISPALGFRRQHTFIELPTFEIRLRVEICGVNGIYPVSFSHYVVKWDEEIKARDGTALTQLALLHRIEECLPKNFPLFKSNGVELRWVSFDILSIQKHLVHCRFTNNIPAAEN